MFDTFKLSELYLSLKISVIFDDAGSCSMKNSFIVPSEKFISVGCLSIVVDSSSISTPLTFSNFVTLRFSPRAVCDFTGTKITEPEISKCTGLILYSSALQRVAELSKTVINSISTIMIF